MYSADSFFTLGTPQQAGLLALSAIMCVLSLYIAWRAASLIVAAVVFCVFLWASPQVYYTYYQFIIEGLPNQWVIGWPDLRRIWAVLIFDAKPSLADHSAGALGWAMVALAIVKKGINHWSGR